MNERKPTLQIACCGGENKHACLKFRCPHYCDARSKVDGSWPRLNTGFGNAYGEPNDGHYLKQVRSDLGNPDPFVMPYCGDEDDPNAEPDERTDDPFDPDKIIC